MVKNVHGGKGHKGFARKNAVSGKAHSKLRVAEEAGEVYARVSKILGGSNLHVECMDTKQRLCHIRGKFKGRGKRDNTVVVGTWVLVGLRDWSASGSSKKDKLEECDLLEVYRDADKSRLKTSVRANWSYFIEQDEANTFFGKAPDTDFTFVTAEEVEAENLIMESMGLQKMSAEETDATGDDIEHSNEKEKATDRLLTIDDDEEDVDIDDI